MHIRALIAKHMNKSKFIEGNLEYYIYELVRERTVEYEIKTNKTKLKNIRKNKNKIHVHDTTHTIELRKILLKTT